MEKIRLVMIGVLGVMENTRIPTLQPAKHGSSLGVNIMEVRTIGQVYKGRLGRNKGVHTQGG